MKNARKCLTRGHSKSTFVEGSEIQFAPSERKNELSMVFSSSISIDDVIKRLRSIDSKKLAAKKIRDVFLAMDFNFQDKFCDAEILEIRGNTFEFLMN